MFGLNKIIEAHDDSLIDFWSSSNFFSLEPTAGIGYEKRRTLRKSEYIPYCAVSNASCRDHGTNRLIRMASDASSVWNLCSVTQTSFRGKTSAGVAKCRLFSRQRTLRQRVVSSPLYYGQTVPTILDKLNIVKRKSKPPAQPSLRNSRHFATPPLFRYLSSKIIAFSRLRDSRVR